MSKDNTTTSDKTTSSNKKNGTSNKRSRTEEVETKQEDSTLIKMDQDQEMNDVTEKEEQDEEDEEVASQRKESKKRSKSSIKNDEIEEDDTPALSHKEKRLAKRRKLAGIPERILDPSVSTTVGGGAAVDMSALVHPSRKAVVAGTASGSIAETGGPAVGNTPAKSAHGVWVGNMNYATTSKDLLQWFAGKGLNEVTRINMPNGKRARENNRGFAYVDFPSATDVEIAVGVSEQHLDGRKLLIKSSSDFTGRPTSATAALSLASIPPSALVQPTVSKRASNDDEDEGNEDEDADEVEEGDDEDEDRKATTTPAVVQIGTIGNQPRPIAGTAQPLTLNRTARKILDRQKNLPGPTLFLGNLGFETTVEDIKEMFDAHQKAMANWAPRDKNAKKKEDKEKKRKNKNKGVGVDDDDDEEGGENASSSEEEEEEEEEEDRHEKDGDEEAEAQDKAGDDEDEDTKKEPEEAKKPKRIRAKKFKPEEKKELDLSKAKDAGIRKIRLGTFEDTGKCKGWAFVDFHLPEQCTRALLNIRNHSLGGRTLNVEYASSDAVRRGAIGTRGAVPGARGGGPGRGGNSGRGRGGPGGGRGQDRDRDNYGTGSSRPWGDSEIRAAAEGGDWSQETAPVRPARGGFGGATRGARGGSDRGRGRGGAGRGGLEKRAKPGAALANAQRASEAIQQSTGKKITFD